MITVTGSLAFDHIMDFPGKFADHIMPDKIHQINLSFYLQSLNKERGGNAGNIAYNLSLLKTPSAILAVAGSDFSEYKQFLERTGIDTSNIKIIKEEPTASAYIMTDQDDNQISAFYPGAITYADSLSIEDLIPKPAFVLIAPDKPAAMIKFITQCQKLDIPYLFDPGMQLPSLTAEQVAFGIKGTEILIGNDYEIELLSNKIQLTGDKLLKQVKVLIITKGEKGSQIQTSDNNYTIPAAKPDKVLDPTGAGDAYRAGFVTGYLKGFDLKVCGQMGSTAAIFAIEKYGTTNHKFTIQQFCDRYKQNFGEELRLL